MNWTVAPKITVSYKESCLQVNFEKKTLNTRIISVHPCSSLEDRKDTTCEAAHQQRKSQQKPIFTIDILNL